MPSHNQKPGRPLRVETGVTDKGAREGRAKRLLKAQLEKTGVNYEELSRRLKGVGIVVPPNILNRKINRGSFSAEFFVECLIALGAKELRLAEPPPPIKIQSLSEALRSQGNGKDRRGN